MSDDRPNAPLVDRRSMSPYDDRLARLELKLDDNYNKLDLKIEGIAQAIQNLARIEERQFAANTRIEKLEARSDEQERALDTLRMQHLASAHSVKLGERVTWAFVTAFASGIAVWVSNVIRLTSGDAGGDV